MLWTSSLSYDTIWGSKLLIRVCLSSLTTPRYSWNSWRLSSPSALVSRASKTIPSSLSLMPSESTPWAANLPVNSSLVTAPSLSISNSAWSYFTERPYFFMKIRILSRKSLTRTSCLSSLALINSGVVFDFDLFISITFFKAAFEKVGFYIERLAFLSMSCTSYS